MHAEITPLTFLVVEAVILKSKAYSLTPWCKTSFEKLIVTQRVKKSCFLYGTRRFIAVFTKARQRNLS